MRARADSSLFFTFDTNPVVLFSRLHSMSTVAAGNTFLFKRSRKERISIGEFACIGKNSQMRFVVETRRLPRYR